MTTTNGSPSQVSKAKVARRAVAASVLVLILVALVAAVSFLPQLTAQARTATTSHAAQAHAVSRFKANSHLMKVSAELKALLDASRAPQNACLQLVQAANPSSVVNGTYALYVEPSLLAGLVKDGKLVTAVKFGDTGALQFSDSPALMLAGNTPEEKMASLEMTVCTNPLIGRSLEHLFANHVTVDGTSVKSMQSTGWLDEAFGNTNVIAKLVAADVPLLYPSTSGDTKGKTDTTDHGYIDAAEAAQNYQKMASKLITLLSHYQLGDKLMSINSTLSYHLVAGGLSADKAPEVEITNKPDTRPAVVLYLTEKNDCKPLSVLGFNVYDARPELGSIPTDCTTYHPACTTACGGTGCTDHCNPGCTHGCCVQVCPKDPTQDVGANPNVSPFLQNGGEKMTVSNGDGSKVANGNQGTSADVTKAQQDAAAKAAADNAADTTAHDTAVTNADTSGGGQVDTDQNKGTSGPAVW